MAHPLIAFGSSMFSAAAGNAGMTALSPVTTVASYAANQAMPVQMPQPELVLAAHLQGFVDQEWLKISMQIHGRSFDTDRSLFTQTSWDGLTLGLDASFNSFRGTIWQNVARTAIYTPTIPETLLLRNRGVCNEELARTWIARQCDNNQDIATAWLTTRFEIPGPSDLIRFAVREAFTPSLIERFGYNKEFPKAILPFMEKQGFGGNTGLDRPQGSTDQDGNAMGGPVVWSEPFWWAHWELPSLTQGYEMVQRLYPNSEYGPSPDVIENDFFTPRELEDLQKAQDIPVYWRKKLQAITYHTIDKIDAERLFNNRMIDDASLYHVYRSKGYNDANSKLLITLAKLQRDRNLGVEPSKVSQEFICKNYSTGILSDNDAKLLLRRNGYTQDQADDFIVKCQLEVQTKTLTEILQHIEQAFYRGIFDIENVTIEFNRIGINPFISEQLQKRWIYKRNVRLKQASARMNSTFFKDGVITEEEFQIRLQNLGYPMMEITTIINDAKVQVRAKILRAMTQQAKAQVRLQQQALKEQQRELKEQVKATQEDLKKKQQLVTNVAKKRLRDFIKVSSDKNIKDWFKAGLIQLWEVYYRLYYKGYSRLDATRWITTNLGKQDEGSSNAAATKGEKQYNSEGNKPISSGNPK